jgi:hypothetical protein
MDGEKQRQDQEQNEEENLHGDPPSGEQVVGSAYYSPGDQRKRSTSAQWWSGCVTQGSRGRHSGEKEAPAHFPYRTMFDCKT